MSSFDDTTGSENLETAGPDDAEPIVFVHGTIFNRTMWAPQREALSDRFRVLTPELPGHGTRSDEPFELEEAIRTLEELVEDETDGTAHLVGLSLGGYVATEFARRNPGAVDHLIIADSSANPVGLLGKVTHLLGRGALRASESERVERAVSGLAAKYVRGREFDQELQEEIIEAGFTLRPFGEAGLEIAGEDFRSALASFPGPALVLNGKWDAIMRLGAGDHAEAGNADVTVIDGAGHISNLDQPEKFAAEVERFVESTATVGAAEH